jgi:hypothetical protein
MAGTTEEQDRERGILSKTDREFLRGQNQDISDQAKRDSRYRIRNRVEDALLDFRVLEDHLAPNDRELIFQHFEFGDIVPVVRFLFLGANDMAESLEDAKENFEEVIETALLPVYTVLDSDHITEDVDVEITIEKTRPDMQELRERIRSGEESIEELQFYLDTDELDVDRSLLTTRLLEHLYKSDALPDELRDSLLEGSEHDSLDDYFADINASISQALDE